MKGWRRVLPPILVALGLGLIGGGALAAQSAPAADGSVKQGEYSFDKADGPAHIYARFDSSKVYIAIVGETSGWVAVGLNSTRMHGAKIFMGYVDGKGPSFTTQAGVRHSHSDTSDFAAVLHGVGEANGATTLELILDRSSFIPAGAASLDIIYAMGSSDSFRQFHSFHGTTSLAVE